ncbi:LapA family protein [Mucilaginibacter dorajii]|uniref:Lipopolysaccharide assembly protein A domain-containing protein n=1 Tax=Mucilaginibacter dorajii TaxID=692994 RepID=A0ABP7QM46_9SPHI|nr:LapA family protein [Mucilaginibacter dorajii]MCS3735896.1 putative integral membrane protein [Mucilaginibacter dorajii]
MSIKTITIIIITVLLTAALAQNTDDVTFAFLFMNFRISKLTIMITMTVIGFVLGYLVGRPKKAKFDIEGYHDNIHTKEDKNTLSDEDRDYIS